MLKTISFSVKHSDLAYYEFIDEEGKVIWSIDGYAPKIGSFEGGDYTSLTIDNETGKILDWVPIKDKMLQEAMDEDA